MLGTGNDKIYLGLSGSHLLVSGFVRQNTNTLICTDLLNILHSFINFACINSHFPIWYHLPSVTSMFIPQETDNSSTELNIYSRAKAERNVIILGSLSAEKYSDYQFIIDKYLVCNIKGIYEFGCISMPKDYNKKRFIDEITATNCGTVETIVNESRLGLVSPWYIDKDQKNKLSHVRSLTSSKKSKHCEFHTIDNEFNVGACVAENGDISWSFENTCICDLKFMYQRWIQRFHTFVVVTLPNCSCPDSKHVCKCQINLYTIPDLFPCDD